MSSQVVGVIRRRTKFQQTLKSKMVDLMILGKYHHGMCFGSMFSHGFIHFKNWDLPNFIGLG